MVVRPIVLAPVWVVVPDFAAADVLEAAEKL